MSVRGRISSIAIFSALLLVDAYAVAGVSLREKGPCSPGYSLSTTDAPACPASDNTKLPETYPAMAYVVSVASMSDGNSGRDFMSQFIKGVFEESGDQVPALLIPNGTSDDLDYLGSQIDEWAKAKFADPFERKKWAEARKRSLKAVGASMPYVYQQDYFETFYDRGTGMPTFRPIRDQLESDSRAMGMALDDTTCSAVKIEQPLPPVTEKKYSFKSANLGGNIEALPGGLCLHGDNQDWETFTKYYCGDKSNDVSIPTDWLKVGHADEVVGLAPNPGAKPPCDFAVTVASPAKAIELLNKDRQSKFVSVEGSGVDKQKQIVAAGLYTSVKSLCTSYLELELQRGPRPSSPDEKSPEDSVKKKVSLLFSLVEEASAATLGATLDGVFGTADACSPYEVAALTNGEVADVLQGHTTEGLLNRLVQKKMDEAKETMRKKLKERLPQCEVTFIDVPQLFGGGAPVEKKGVPASAPDELRFELPKGMMTSVLPNPANSLPVGKSGLFSPEPHNAVFKSYLTGAYQAIKVKPTYMDTLSAAHIGNGNLHCMTHKIPFCRPVKK